MAVRWYINLSLCDYQACVLCQGANQEKEAGQKSVHRMCTKTGVGVGGEDHMDLPTSKL